MDSEQTLRGADPVNDELEVGFNLAFERRWWRAEFIGRLVMLAFIAAGLAGLMGRGPYSHHTLQTRAHDFAVDFEPVARNGTSTQVTLHLTAPRSARPVTVTINSAFVEPMGLGQIIPRPSSQTAGHAEIAMTFNLPPGEPDALVRFILTPSAVGPVELSAHQDDREGLRWTQFVLP